MRIQRLVVIVLQGSIHHLLDVQCLFRMYLDEEGCGGLVDRRLPEPEESEKRGHRQGSGQPEEPTLPDDHQVVANVSGRCRERAFELPGT